MILHILTISVVLVLLLLFIFHDTILEYMSNIWDKYMHKKEHKEAVKHLGEHKGMYHYFKEEENK